MDEFKPENEIKSGDNSLKPDTSDRPERRTNRPRNNPLKNARFSVSRQQMMIGVGVLVLILLIIAISSALKSPDSDKETTASTTGTEKNIELSQPSVTSTDNQTSTPQELTGQQIQQPTTQPSQNLPPMIDSQGQRVEIPGDIVDSLNQQQAGVNQAVNQQQQNTQNQPTTPQTPVTKPQPAPTQKPEVKPTPTKPVTPPATTQTKPVAKPTTKPVASGALSVNNLAAIPATNYTLQLSGASRQDTLEAFAKKNLNGNYAIYKTQRNGNPWYVLIYGNYRNISEAKQAVASLPAAVQAKKPWVRPMKHVHQDLKK